MRPRVAAACVANPALYMTYDLSAVEVSVTHALISLGKKLVGGGGSDLELPFVACAWARIGSRLAFIMHA